jgi:hypothetical protein
MHQHPAVRNELMKDRVAELRRDAAPTALTHRNTRPRKLIAAVRRGTGWLLVDMGLRLAVPRGGTNHRLMLDRRSRSA